MVLWHKCPRKNLPNPNPNPDFVFSFGAFWLSKFIGCHYTVSLFTHYGDLTVIYMISKCYVYATLRLVSVRLVRLRLKLSANLYAMSHFHWRFEIWFQIWLWKIWDLITNWDLRFGFKSICSMIWDLTVVKVKLSVTAAMLTDCLHFVVHRQWVTCFHLPPCCQWLRDITLSSVT